MKKRTLGLVVAVLVSLASSMAMPTQAGASSAAMLLAGQASYNPGLLNAGIAGCPGGVLFGPPPKLIDGCLWPRPMTWFLNGVGAITGSSGAAGSFGCVIYGEPGESTLYGQGDVQAQCSGGGVIGTTNTGVCNLYYTRVGLIAVFSGLSPCISAIDMTAVLVMVPTDSTGGNFEAFGALAAAA
jgi:hypothetical protein